MMQSFAEDEMSRVRGFAAALVCVLATPTNAAQSSGGDLYVGASRVELTPAAADLPDTYRGVLDPVFVRAITIRNPTTQVGLVTVDALSVSTPIAQRLSASISAATGISSENLLIAGTGTHSVPMVRFDPAVPSEQFLAWEARIVDAVVQAKRREEAALMTFGTGQSYINVQRDRIDPVTRRWWEGPDYNGVSDKEVSVLSFSSADGHPIAAYYNYGVFNVVTGMLDLVSGDVTGAASRYIEEAIGEDFVAALALGAHGDQNPIFFNQTFQLRDLRIAQYAERGEDIRIAMPPPGGVGLDRSDPRVAQLMDQQRQVNSALGLMLGEEVLRILRDSPEGIDRARLVSRRTSVTCPGRVRLNEGRGGVAGVYRDDAPVQIDLGLMLIGDVAIGAVSGTPYAAIGLRLKRESPFNRTMLLTRANGYSAGYIPDDASYGHQTFAVLNTRLSPGCAEEAVIDGILGLIPDEN